MDTLTLSSGRKIEYTLRRSPAARRMRIAIQPDGCVELVLPRSVSEEEGQTFLMQSETWIERTKHKILSRPVIRQTFYPEHFCFPLTGEDFLLQYEFRDVCWCGAAEKESVLTVSGNVTDPLLVKQTLEHYLIRKSQKVFEAELNAVSQKCVLPFESLTTRLQKGRWGSCSGRRHISLNARLLFLAPEAVHYVMIHELCHTRELNHSGRFWRLVEQHCPQWRKIRDSMKRVSMPL